MTLTDLLAELDVRRVTIEVVAGWLRLNGPPNALTPGLRAGLAEHKAELLTLLEPETRAAQTAPATLSAQGAGDVPAGQGDHRRVSDPARCSRGASRTPHAVREHAVREAPFPGGPEGTLRIRLDDLVYGDFLARHGLRVVGGTPYPDGRTFRPTIYLARDTSG